MAPTEPNAAPWQPTGDDGASDAVPPCRSVIEVYRRHGDFVWHTLQRLGAADADLEDLFQEVFVVVHRQWPAFEGRSQVTTWLFSITERVLSTWRRRAWRRREAPTDAPPEQSTAGAQDDRFAEMEARAALTAVLDAMSPEHRIVFVMAVVEELPQPEIAHQLGIPLGTVYSRLHAARADFEQRVARLQRTARRTP